MEADLIWTERGTDTDGFPKNTEKKYPVFVNEKSITRQEAYESMRAGVTVKMVLTTRQEDWEQSRHLDSQKKPEYATMVDYDGARYDVIRTYKIGKSQIEIVLG
ncbi:hypothetical protein [Cuneatibacter caecimuris]|uniref:Uncharacterized protein n=1 Tax=Cuneatibacter caecimuris TaxID=1796618 RepID=A0A4Q7PJP2_9FIRM|nr:hypothetical protein [Cuneatibacter caecimuris]RZT00904.1 hypothetical protein EV209_1340 [Cuneatibacter caecimuris]